MRGVHARGHDEGRERGEQAGIRVHRDQVGAHRHAGELERAPVAADGEDVAAKLGSIQQQVSSGEDKKDSPYRHRQAEPASFVEPAHRARQPGHRVPLGEHHREALRHAIGAERDDEGRHAGVRDEGAVRSPGENSYRNRGEHGDRQRSLMRNQKQAHHHAAKAEQRAEAQIDALGEDDERHAEGEDDERRGLQPDVGQVARRGKLGARQCEHRAQQREQVRGPGQLGQDRKRQALRARGCAHA